MTSGQVGLIFLFLTNQSSSFLSASDWATAVCGHLGGSAGGSVLVAKGTGSSSDISEAVKWAEEFALLKIKPSQG